MNWFKWFDTAKLPAVTEKQKTKEIKMAKATKKPMFAWGYEFKNGSYYSEFFGTKSAAKEFAADTAFNDDFKIVKFVVKKYSAK